MHSLVPTRRQFLHRTASAAVLATAPEVLLLDEPSSGLDPLSARRLKDLLLEQAARGTTVFLSTHGLELAERDHQALGAAAHGAREVWRARCGARGRSRTDTLFKAVDFRPASAFAAVAKSDVRGLEHAFTVALRKER